jgi:vacuole morphology and inheritance protein 14
MRYAFYAYDNLLDQKLVVKMNKKSELNSIGHMSKDLELVYICQHLVNTFNDSIVQEVPDTRLLLTFVHTFLIELKKTKQMYYAENFIAGAYEKFSNNAGWETNKVSESSLISHAFSHYSYQATEGYLMVVDIQGSSGILTDPQIHCLDTERFGAGNLGYEGILKFFFNHTCNHYCKSLNLINPKNTS